MDAIKLEDLIPEKPEFHIKSRNKVYAIRPPNMLDQVWFKERYGAPEQIQRVIGEQDWAEITRIVYHQLSQSDRLEFPSQNATIVNDDGDQEERRLTGPEVLLTALGGLEEAIKMLGALTKAIIVSNPLAEAKVMEEVKKNLSQSGIQIGEKSLTSSKISTDGARGKSRSKPRGK